MSKAKTPMSPAAAARIQSATAKQHGGNTPKGSFAAKAQSAAARNMASSGQRPPNGPSTTGGKSGKGRGNNPPRSK
ncbi:hypothetical protein JF541_12045 [Marinobacter hydrocarbonoclasticus]|uniref:hypothetical protein n=1 Tax=Marinobacter TaxID=2742 RepID=UPI0009DE4281|nr:MULTISPECIES: hypothetical protein [Marinobacter]MBN8239885.1 hypothetical protein [Marinobacter nauticus]